MARPRTEAGAKPAARGGLLPMRIFLLLAVLVAVGFYVRATSRAYRAFLWAENFTPENLRTAARLQPDNAEFHYRLGRYSLLMQDFPSAITDLTAAIALNPHDARYWLDLASANLATDNPALTQQALARAIEADPTTPEVVWQTANYELVQGDTELALRRFHDLVENDDEAMLKVLNVCWRATRDPDLIAEKVLPPRPDDYFTFIRFLQNKKPPQAADNVWSHLIALKRPFAPSLAFPYLDSLIGRGELAKAEEAWAQLAVANPEFRPYVPSDDRIVNGGFELDLLNGGLDWRYSPQQGASVVIDDRRAHTGNRSLSISFEGSPADSGVIQLVPVHGNTHYQFRAFMMSEDLETTSPPRFAIHGFSHNQQYLLTDGVTRAPGWQELTGEFTTGPQGDLLLVRIARVPSQRLIRGRIWVDDVALLPKTMSGGLQ